MADEDNREDAPGRLFGVGEQVTPERPDLGEHQVTLLVGRTLSERASAVRPSGADLAGVAIKRARRVQRRRRGAGLAAVMLATASVTGALLMGLSEEGSHDDGDGSIAGLFSDADRDDPAPADPPTDPSREVSLAADGAVVDRVTGGLVGESDSEGLVLATGDGVLTDLGPISDISSIHRVTGGWVVVTAGGDAARLWWVTDGAKPRALLSGVDDIVADGARVAWRLGSRLSAAVMVGGELEQRVEVQAPAADVRPAGLLGNAVLLRRTAGGGALSWALWRPDECATEQCADLDPIWNTQALRVYGTEPGGESALGLVPSISRDQGVCLAQLRIESSLPVAQRVCPVGLPSAGPASLSPDGRWLVAASGNGLVVVDIEAAFSGDPAAVREVGGAAAPAANPVWSEPGEAVYATEDSLVWVRPERLPGEDAVIVAGLSGAPPTLIQLSR